MVFASTANAALGEMTGSLAAFDTPRGSVSSELSDDGDTLTIRISGRFDFSLHEAFFVAFENQERTCLMYVVDLKDTDSIDSSALGMLLFVWEKLGGERAAIRLVGGSRQIQKSLKMANLGRLSQ
jgi:anti-anti-sigma factor